MKVSLGFFLFATNRRFFDFFSGARQRASSGKGMLPFAGDRTPFGVMAFGRIQSCLRQAKGGL